MLSAVQTSTTLRIERPFAYHRHEPPTREEEPMPLTELNHYFIRANDLAGLAYIGAQYDHHVADLADRVTLGIEHRQPGQPGREDARWCGAHARTLDDSHPRARHHL